MVQTDSNTAEQPAVMPPAAGQMPFPFIVGSGRSGTTLLRMMLDSHPDIAVPPETQFIPQVVEACRRAADPREAFLKSLMASSRWPDFCLDEGALKHRLSTIQPFDVSEAFRVFYRLYAERFGKRRWGDQTPSYASDVVLLRDLFPEARFIQVIRDGRDVVLSYREVWFSPGSPEQLARHWLNRTEAAQQARWFEHYLETRYEDLIQRPEATLRQVCGFLDLPWHPAMLQYPARAGERMSELYREYKAPGGRRTITPDERLSTHRLVTQPPDTSRIGRWRREMAYIDVVEVEDIAGEKLLALGYPLVTRGTMRARFYRVVLSFRRRAVRARRALRVLSRSLRDSPGAWREALWKFWRGGIGPARPLLGRAVARPATPGPYQAVRSSRNPIIRPGMGHGLGGNFNGPSLIQVPTWLPNSLGRYYLYFAHHQGAFIRLAYADRLDGPWTVYQPGTLHLSETVGVEHIASPDVHIDDKNRQIRMYFHCPVPGGRDQKSFVATSEDGLHFTARPEVLGRSYFRVFRWGEHTYAMARTGALYRSRDGLAQFEPGPNPFPNGWSALTVRHTAVRVEGHTLQVFYSLIGDTPERILLAGIDLRPDWTQWRAGRPAVVLEPETDYEGAHLPLESSQRGRASRPVRQLRDPAIFREGDKTYLVYSVAGESGLAIAELCRAGGR